MKDPLFASVKTTDDDDDEAHLAGDGGPTATLFRDDPQPLRSVFDWGTDAVDFTRDTEEADTEAGGLVVNFRDRASDINFRDSGAKEHVPDSSQLLLPRGH